jgi:hypothetical protein
MAVTRKATAATDRAGRKLRAGRRCNQMITAPTATKTATMRWLMTVAASSAAGIHRP